MSKGGRANDDGVAAEVLAVAKALRLTNQQFNFALALAVDPNQTKAAEAAGVDPSRSAIQGSRWARMGKVQALVSLLTSKATAMAQAKTGRSIASLAEALAFNTTVMRSKITDYITDGEVDYEKLKDVPAGLLRKLRVSTTTNEEGQVFTRTDIETESALAASVNLIKHYQDKDDGDRAEGALLAALRELPPESVRLIVRRMLTGPKPIDVTARLLP